jgi:uncharacterized ion transporter superfamily protein YfcC
MVKKTLLVLLFLVIAILGVFFVWRYVNYVRDPDPNKSIVKDCKVTLESSGSVGSLQKAAKK